MTAIWQNDQGFSHFERRRMKNERGHSQQVSLEGNLLFFMHPPQHLAETLFIPVAKSKMTLVLNSNSLNSKLEKTSHRYLICVRAARDNEHALGATSQGMFVGVSMKQVAYDFSKELMPE